MVIRGPNVFLELGVREIHGIMFIQSRGQFMTLPRVKHQEGLEHAEVDHHRFRIVVPIVTYCMEVLDFIHTNGCHMSQFRPFQLLNELHHC